MTLHTFYKKFRGKTIKWGNESPCVAFVRQYFKDVWNLVQQPEAVEAAKDFFIDKEKNPLYRSLQRQMLSCVTYAKGLEPTPGAVVVFDGSPSNSRGHVGICYSVQPGAILLLEQDDYRRDGVMITRWNYDRVLGWLLKNENM